MLIPKICWGIRYPSLASCLNRLSQKFLYKINFLTKSGSIFKTICISCIHLLRYLKNWKYWLFFVNSILCLHSPSTNLFFFYFIYSFHQFYFKHTNFLKHSRCFNILNLFYIFEQYRFTYQNQDWWTN